MLVHLVGLQLETVPNVSTDWLSYNFWPFLDYFSTQQCHWSVKTQHHCLVHSKSAAHMSRSVALLFWGCFPTNFALIWSWPSGSSPQLHDSCHPGRVKDITWLIEETDYATPLSLRARSKITIHSHFWNFVSDFFLMWLVYSTGPKPEMIPKELIDRYRRGKTHPVSFLYQLSQVLQFQVEMKETVTTGSSVFAMYSFKYLNGLRKLKYRDITFYVFFSFSPM